MKKLIYCSLAFLVAVMLVVFFSWGNGLNRTIENEVERMTKEMLYKPETYASISTSIDSAFSPYDNPKLIYKVMEWSKCCNEGVELLKELNRAEDDMMMEKQFSSWSSYYEYEYDKSLGKYNELKSKYDKFMLAQNEKLKEIKEMFNGERHFIGYRVRHRYRADNNFGYSVIGEYVFIFTNDSIYGFPSENFYEYERFVKSGDIDLLLKIDSLDNTMGLSK